MRLSTCERRIMGAGIHAIRQKTTVNINEYEVCQCVCFSDGIGRSGTYCLIDTVLSRLSKGNYCSRILYNCFQYL